MSTTIQELDFGSTGIGMKFKTKPYNHQLEAYEKCYGSEYFALFMEQGTGKTKTAIDIASNLFLEGKINAVLLVAPNGVQEQWADEQLPIHSPVPYKKWVWKASKGKLFTRLQEEFLVDPYPKHLKWFCANVETFSTKNHLRTFIEYVMNNKCMIIIDEATRIKNHKAKRSYYLTYALTKFKKHGRKIIDVLPYAKYRCILTGTMITNSPYDLWSMFEFLKHDYFNCNYYAFKAHYGLEVRDTNPGTGQIYSRKIRPSEIASIQKYISNGQTPEQVSYIMNTSESNIKYILKHPDVNVPYKNLEELKKEIAAVSYIVRKEDCLDLPPKVYEHIYVEMNSEQKRIYKELKKQLLSEYEEKELTVQNKVSLIGRLQQVTGGFFPYEEDGRKKIFPITNKNPKIEAVIADLDETGNEIIIIWARFRAELKMLYNELTKVFPAKRIELYYGGVDRDKRVPIRRDFQEGLVDILIANARTAGIGLNLQRSHLHYYYSNSYSLEDRVQSEDRSHRFGQEHSVLYKDIIVRNTVDEKVHEVLKSKRELLDYFRDTSFTEFIGGKE